MTEKDLAAVQAELAELRARIVQLEAEEETQQTSPPGREWTREYYLTYHATAGFFLGMIAALASLVFNVVGSLFAGLHPLQIIKVYLTFGLGEKALDPALDSGVALAVGCCLYIATGMLLGIPFQLVLSRVADSANFGTRLIICTAIAVAIWVVNYYLILSWLQPLLFHGNWITDPKFMPIGVAALTHLVFGWTMALVYPLGIYEPYRVKMD